MQASDLIQHFVTASVQGIPLLLVVVLAVQWVKGLGVTGNNLRIASLLIGALLGVGYQFAVLPEGTLPAPPLAVYSLIFGVFVYGLALGLLASALVDLSLDLVTKALRSLPFRRIEPGAGVNPPQVR